jgi:CubicO group peptidase (beta-lactamase class C family)
METGSRSASAESAAADRGGLDGLDLEYANGYVAPGFEQVATEFERNFSARGDVGAAFAVVRRGETLVDLWGGWADIELTRPWRSDTLQVIFSGAKGLVAACLLMLVERGSLDLAAPVPRYWPEFAANGKDRTTVAEIASHRGRLPGIRVILQDSDLLDDVAMAALLAEQAPETDARARHAYHPLTFGWLCGELIRRVDGRSVGQFFADEIARPLGLETWIGLPPNLEERVSTLTFGRDWIEESPWQDADFARDALLASIYANPRNSTSYTPMNSSAYHEAEIPGANAISTARSMARFYACLARGGEIDGVRILRPETIELGLNELSSFVDPFQDESMRFGLGFALQTPEAQFGPPATAFGHNGAGGSVHTAWPDQDIGVSYAMNEMRNDDTRSKGLLRAVFDAVESGT